MRDFRTPTRRTVLTVAGTLATVTFMSACAGTEAGGDAEVEPQEDTTQMQAAVQRLVSEGSIPVGGAEFLDDEGVIVTHPAQDEYRVFSDVCPHQQGRVSAVDEASGRLVCPLHGSQFDSTTGDVVVGPSAEGLTPMDVDVAAPAPAAT